MCIFIISWRVRLRMCVHVSYIIIICIHMDLRACVRESMFCFDYYLCVHSFVYICVCARMFTISVHVHLCVRVSLALADYLVTCLI